MMKRRSAARTLWPLELDSPTPSGGTAMSTPSLSALQRPGWLTFAAVTMLAVGFMRVISAISYFADSHKVNNLSNGLFGDQIFLWGIWDLAIAALAIWAGYSLLNGHTAGRVIGYIWAILVLMQSFLILGYAPWFGFAAILLAMLVIYALSSTSDWREDV
jgi:hypothetical protein